MSVPWVILAQMRGKIKNGVIIFYMNPQSLGQLGEKKAADYLRKKGYAIVAANFKTKWGELDIVAKKKAVLVFIEVKTLRQKDGFFPEDRVDWKKERQLKKIVQIYLSANKIPLDIPHQIDVVAVEINETGQLVDIRHFENAIEDV